VERVSEWREVRVEEIASTERNALVGGPFGSNLVSNDYVSSGVPVIRGQNMGTGRWVGGDFAFVSEEKAQELSANTARPGDLVFTQRGTLGQVSLIKKEGYLEYIVSQSQMKLTPHKEKADSVFLYYLFSSEQQQNYIRANAIQTGVPHTNLGFLRKTPLFLPPLPIQRQIAAILSAFDDKIELNRQMNRTLEQMARALFQSWFVDFDPVRAKMRGEEPQGMDAATAALFPDEVVEVEGREVPKGWRVGSLSDYVEFNPTLRLKKDEEATYLDMSNMPTSGMSAAGWIKRAVGSGAKFQNGDTLLARITPCLENGKAAFIDFLKAEEVAWGSTEYIVMRPKANTPLIFPYLLARDVEFRKFAIGNMNGSSGRQRVSHQSLSTYLLPVPNSAVLLEFERLTRASVDISKSLRNESAHLAQLRDSLLPRLLSGEVDVSEWAAATV
jgi:type I restriction enzyme S subunit